MKAPKPQKLTAAEYGTLAKTWTETTPAPNPPLQVKGPVHSQEWGYNSEITHIPPATIMGNIDIPKTVRKLPEGMVVKGRLNIQDNPHITEVNVRAETIVITNCKAVSSILSAGTSLNLDQCENIRSIKGNYNSLRVDECPAFEGHEARVSGELTVVKCPKFTSVSGQLGTRVTARKCPNFAGLEPGAQFADPGSLIIEESLMTELNGPLPDHIHISNCPNLTKIGPGQVGNLGVTDLPALEVIEAKGKEVWIRGCPKVRVFGDETTTKLSVTGNEHLKEVQLALESLSVDGCPNFILNGAPKSLRVRNCPQITEISTRIEGFLDIDACENFSGFSPGLPVGNPSCIIKGCPKFATFEGITTLLSVEDCPNYTGVGPNGKVGGKYFISACPKLEPINHPVGETITCRDDSFKGVGPLATGSTLYLKNQTISLEEYKKNHDIQ